VGIKFSALTPSYLLGRYDHPASKVAPLAALVQETTTTAIAEHQQKAALFSSSFGLVAMSIAPPIMKRPAIESIQPYASRPMAESPQPESARSKFQNRALKGVSLLLHQRLLPTRTYSSTLRGHGNNDHLVRKTPGKETLVLTGMVNPVAHQG
jgi:hypothetical protein